MPASIPAERPPRPRTDCAHYRGDLPCALRKVCWECDEFRPIGRRALVIKFGAPGDALRTTPILAKLRSEGYEEITWICDAASREVLALCPGIDRLLVHGQGALETVLAEEFHLVLSLDKDPAARSLAALSRSPDRRGFTATPAGRLEAFDSRSDYALRLGMDDELKFRGNTLTVPQILFAMCGWTWNGERYAWESAPPPAPVPGQLPPVALNLGCGPRWPTKAWPEEEWIQLAGLLRGEGFSPFFAGGEAERALVERCATAAGVEALPPMPVREFARSLAGSACVVTADSLGLHLALAVERPVVGLFCSTVDAEIEWFGIGEALRGHGGPCYNPRCGKWPGCMRSISPMSVAARVRAVAAPPGIGVSASTKVP